VTKPKTPPAPLDETAAPPNGMRHNGPPTAEEQERALAIYHLSKLRIGEAAMLKAKESYQQTTRDLKALFDTARDDTGYKRKEYQKTLDKMRASHTDLLREYARQAILDGFAGLPVALPPQQEFDFDADPDKAQELHAYRLGYAAGMLGGDPDVPETIHLSLAPAYQRGWNTAQETLGWALGVVGRLADEKTAEAGKGKLEVGEQSDIEDGERAFGPTEGEQVFA